MLHLSAHGSPDSVELEDEDGAPVQVTSKTLMEALRHANRAVPLIVLSTCYGGSTGSEAMAAGLIAKGADRVIAMLGSVSDDYATILARRFYGEIARARRPLWGKRWPGPATGPRRTARTCPAIGWPCRSTA